MDFLLYAEHVTGTQVIAVVRLCHKYAHKHTHIEYTYIYLVLLLFLSIFFCATRKLFKIALAAIKGLRDRHTGRLGGRRERGRESGGRVELHVNICRVAARCDKRAH